MYCMWFIRGPDDRRIKIDFEDLDFPTTTAWIHPHTNRTYHWCKTGVRVSISSLVLHTVICIILVTIRCKGTYLNGLYFL